MSKIVLEISQNKEKILGISRRYIGATLGIIVFLCLLFVSASIKQLQLLAIGLSLPGAIIFTYIILPLKFPSELVTILHYLFIFGLSSIPAGFIGFHLFSTDKSIGKRFLVIYLVYLLSVIVVGYIVIGNLYYYLNF